jgi:hypothetical protein
MMCKNSNTTINNTISNTVVILIVYDNSKKMLACIVNGSHPKSSKNSRTNCFILKYDFKLITEYKNITMETFLNNDIPFKSTYNSQNYVLL